MGPLEETMGQKPRTVPRDVPDSLPKRDQGTDVLPDDVLPDDVRRIDPQTVSPDSLPEADEETSLDGGVAQHPVHDSDQENRDPQDYEDAIDDLEKIAVVDSAERS
jgi:hypothetical protein